MSQENFKNNKDESPSKGKTKPAGLTPEEMKKLENKFNTKKDNQLPNLPEELHIDTSIESNQLPDLPETIFDTEEAFKNNPPEFFTTYQIGNGPVKTHLPPPPTEIPPVI